MIRCKSCLQEHEEAVCPHCGYPERSSNEKHQLPEGTMLRSRYQIGRVLGQGGFGITYIAWDTLMQRPVAVKEFFPNGMVYRRSEVSLRVDCITDRAIPHYERNRERFLREASALVKFQDIPEVVSIHDFLEENNTAYIVMEYVRGVDLAKYIRMKGGKLSPQETFRILKPVMDALAKVHKGGIIHRDISPDNIILDPLGGAKILDFGAVRSVEDPDTEKGLNKSTEAILKQGFAPLEQYNSRGSLGPWTDEYAMCATVWYCLTGRVPEEVTIRMAEGSDPDWSSIEGLPEHQQTALKKGISCLAKDRYKTMDDLVDALFSEPKPDLKPRKTQPVTRPAGKRKKKLLFPAVAAVVIILAAFVALAVTRSPQWRYDQAMGLMETEKYQLAAHRFDALGDYSDSAAMALRCRYLQAEALMDAGRYQEAIEQFTALGSHGNSGEKILECRYLQAEALLNEGRFQEATDSFKALEGYKDSADRVRECTYRWAEHLLNDGQFSDAITKFSTTRNYLDSTTRVQECYYRWAEALFAAERFEEASAKFIASRGYLDSGERALECHYRNGHKALAEHRYDEAANSFILAGGYSDSRDMAKQSYYVWAEDALEAGNVGQAAIAFYKAGSWKDAKARSKACWDQAAFRDTFSAGSSYSAGVRPNGTVVTAGHDFLNNTRADTSSWKDIIAVSVGDSHIIGLQANGTVVATGFNSHWQCNVSGWTDIVAISTGPSHTVGLRADGTVVATGYNGNRQCNVSGWTDIVAVSAGMDHTIGLRADGTVVTAGVGNSGECNVFAWTDIIAVGAGHFHSVGLRADGTVVATGDNTYGQRDVSGWTDIVAISVGFDYTVGLRADGTLVATGENNYGQCNVGTWTDIVAVSASRHYTIGMRSDGSLVAVGGNSPGMYVTSWGKLRLPYDRDPIL